MLKTIQKTKGQKGFTIIEVLIVLAIAGLILLIVFLAVPALQRNSRNTSRRNDISRILGGVQEVADNNNGQINTTVVTASAVNTAVGTLGYYQGSNLSVKAYASGDAAVTGASASDTVVIELGASCGSNGAPAQGTARQVAVLFAVETSGGTTPQCTAS